MLKIQNLFLNNDIEFVKKYLEEINVSYVEEISPFTGKKYIHLDYKIEADFNEIVNECRGLTLDENFEIMRYGYYRFYDLGRDCCDINVNSNIKDIEFESKEDGSLIILSYFEDQWIAGTRGSTFNNSYVFKNKTYSDLFWETINIDKNKLDKDICYMFEFCSTKNRIVVKYNNDELFLTGARRKSDNWSELKSDELDIIAKELNVLRPKIYKFNSIEKCVLNLLSLDLNHEGYVLKRWNDNLKRYERAKAKGKQYLEASRIICGLSLSSFVSMILSDKYVFFEKDFEEIYKEACELKDIIIEESGKVDYIYQLEYDKVKDIENDGERKKQFVINIKNIKTKYEKEIFNIYQKNTGFYDYLISQYNYLINKTGNAKILCKKIISLFDLHNKLKIVFFRDEI